MSKISHPSSRLAPAMRLVAASSLRPLAAQLPAWEEELSSLARQVGDWREVARLVSRHQLDGLAHGALCGLPAAAGVPRPLLESLADAARKARLAALLRLGEAGRIADAFQRAGIAAVQLKGTPLSARLYGDALLRHSVDIDVLVAPAALAEVLAILERLGFATDEHVPLQPGWKARLQRRAYHHCLLRNGRVLLELHWRLGTYSETHTDRLLAQAGSEQGFGQLPQMVELAYLIAHGTSHYWARLKWLSDIKQALLRTSTARWGEFLTECAAAGAQHAVEVTRCVLAAVFTTASSELPSAIPMQGRHRRSAHYALQRMQAPLVPEPGMRSVLSRTRYRLDCAAADDKLAVLLRCADRVRRLAHHS